MHVVLGVSITPTTIRAVLVGGENVDGNIVDQGKFDVTTDHDAPTVIAPDHVISAILSAREDAAAKGDLVTYTGVAWADPESAATVHERLAVRKIENVILVSALSAAAAVARAFGSAARYAHTALLYVEPASATLAVVDTAGGSVADLRQRFLPDDDDAAVASLVEMLKGADEMQPRPQGVFIVGSGVDIPLIKPALETATPLPVHAAGEPRKAPARVSANAPRRYGPAILETRNLCKSFGHEPSTTPILKNIDLRIFPGEFVALIGPSGSGKSTLLSILGLLEPPTSGDVLVNQHSASRLSTRELAAVRGRRIGYVFQSFNLLGGLSVAENVMLPSLLAGESGHAQYNRAIALLDQFGLAAFAKRVPAELSGGEQQRVAIARALFMAPDVILADEPTGNLDTRNGHIVIETLYRLNAAGQTIVLVTHDLSIANKAPRLISLLDGRIEKDTGLLQRDRNAAWRPSR